MTARSFGDTVCNKQESICQYGYRYRHDRDWLTPIPCAEVDSLLTSGNWSLDMVASSVLSLSLSNEVRGFCAVPERISHITIPKLKISALAL